MLFRVNSKKDPFYCVLSSTFAKHFVEHVEVFLERNFRPLRKKDHCQDLLWYSPANEISEVVLYLQGFVALVTSYQLFFLNIAIQQTKIIKIVAFKRLQVTKYRTSLHVNCGLTLLLIIPRNMERRY